MVEKSLGNHPGLPGQQTLRPSPAEPEPLMKL
jgi:hypothetical protein